MASVVELCGSPCPASREHTVAVMTTLKVFDTAWPHCSPTEINQQWSGKEGHHRTAMCHELLLFPDVQALEGVEPS